jgi:hypothetical protein
MNEIDMISKMKSLLRRKNSCILATTRGTLHRSLMASITSETLDRPL